MAIGTSGRDIRRVAVLGAGTMGSRIAAHIADAGLPVVLLDIVPPGTAADAPRSERNKFVLGALEGLKK
jgi:3-hydroxyacyl-CoA dehydrogenase